MIWRTLTILPALLAAAGFVLLRYACARRDGPEPWDEAELDKRGNPALKDGVLAGRAWLEAKETEWIEIGSDDGWRLRGMLVPQLEPRATVLMFHGWRSSWKIDFSSVLRFLYDRGLQLLLVEQRAQGESEGRYMTYGVRERFDVAAWVKYAAERFGAEHPLFLDGLSMGATSVLMASSLALAGNVRGIIADCGFTSPYEILKSVWERRTHLPAAPALWLLGLYTRLFAGFGLKEYSTLDALAETKYPVLLIHGAGDRFVPCEMSQRAFDACKSEKRLLLVEGAAHGMSYLADRGRVEAAAGAFIEGHLS